MADFCKQCSIAMFGEDTGDLKGLGNGKPLPKGHGWQVLCEGCGPTLVLDDGSCMGNCIIKEHENEKDRL